MYSLSGKSLSRLQGVHPHLVAVVKRAIEITEVDFSVLEGRRSIERQKELFAKGASKTMNSRHLTGHAVDLGAYVEGKISWDHKWYPPIAKAMKQASEELDIPIEWGGDWKSFVDSPHFQLPFSKYSKDS